MAKLRKIVIQSYAFIALVTFGAAAERHGRDSWAEYSVCQSVALNNGKEGSCWTPSGFEDAIVGSVSGMLWPLYASWLLAEYLGGRNG